MERSDAEKKKNVEYRPRNIGIKVCKKIDDLEEKIGDILDILRSEEEEFYPELKKKSKREEYNEKKKKSPYHEFISANFHKHANKGLLPRQIIAKLAQEWHSKHGGKEE